MNGYENAVKEILLKNGWIFGRQAKGSHEYWLKPNCKPITVPKNCKSRHTANAIMKAAGIDHKF
jgi:predicted RNA binding protein YcfA (HicA-like mRNA interferase family)